MAHGAPETPRTPRTITDLGAGDHLCCLYETEEEHLAVLTPYLRQGLDRGERVTYIVDARTAETVLGYLRDDGLDPEPFVARGQLVILSSDDTYLRGGTFDPEGMIALLRSETERALAEGYPALRVTGEMTWALRGLTSIERLVQYEVLLNEFFPGSLCLAICQYDRRRFEPSILLEVLRTHPYVVIGPDVYASPHFVPPASFYGADRQAAQLDGWMQGLIERRQAEEALRTSEERHRTILRTVMDGFWLADVQGRILEVNEAYCRMSGYSAQELLTMRISDLDAVETADDMTVHINEVIAQGKDRFESRHRRRNGGVFDVEVSVQYRSAEDGRLVVFLRDITERKQAEAEMTRLRQAVAASSEAIFMTDREGLMTFVNPGFTDLYGFTAEEVVGKTTPRILKSGVMSKEAYEGFSRALQDKQEMKGELVNRTKDGRLLNIEGSANAVLDETGQIVGFVAIQRDITERKKAETEIRRLNEELEERVRERTVANRELESFSYSVSHDLRAPLRAITGFAEILGRRYRERLDAKGRHYLDTIAASGAEMGVLIEELLDYARLGRGSVRAEPVPLGPLVTGLRSTFGDRLAAAGATLAVREPLAVPVGDPTLLERILVNLVANALTYQRPDTAPAVILSATRHGRTVTLAVADNGIGIPAEHHERIFEVFTRLHAEEAYPGGTGIGLSIVRKAARLMGSEVTLESVEGVGSTFSLVLPAAPEGRTQA